jgi:hypothetical protein
MQCWGVLRPKAPPYARADFDKNTSAAHLSHPLLSTPSEKKPLPGGPGGASYIARAMTTATAYTAPASAPTTAPAPSTPSNCTRITIGAGSARTGWKAYLDLATGQIYHVPLKR